MPVYVFTVSCSLANTVKKDVGLSHDKRFRTVVSVLREVFRSEEDISLTWSPIHLHVADPFDENDGQEHSRCIFLLSCISVDCPDNAGTLRKLMRIVTPRNVVWNLEEWIHVFFVIVYSSCFFLSKPRSQS